MRPATPGRRSWSETHPSPTTDDLTRFWIDDGLASILPPGDNPAGFDELELLSEVYRLSRATDVVELGCGYGRLAGAFAPERYLGLDVNPAAIEKARTFAPRHRFRLIDFDAALPAADLCLAYTVLLHVDDRNIRDLARRITASFGKLLIVEILGRRGRDGRSSVPNYRRDRRDYERIFDRFELQLELRKPYRRYRDRGLELSYVLLARRHVPPDAP